MSDATPLASKKKRLLVVEDDADARAIYDATLRYGGFDVTCAATKRDGAAFAAQLRPDLVVLDCRLPDGNGLDLLRDWRQTRSMRHMPVVVLTAYAGNEDFMAASVYGASGVVTKPCSGHALTAYVTRVLGSGGAAPPAPRRRLRRSSPLAVVRPPADLVPRLDRGAYGELHARCGGCLRGSPTLGAAMSDASRRLRALGWRCTATAWQCPICLSRRSSEGGPGARRT